MLRRTTPVTLDAAQPFLRQDGVKAGIPRHQLDSAAYHRIFHAVRVSVDTPVDTEMLARAALLVAPQGVISHFTAAQLWGGIVPHAPDIHVTVRSRKIRPQFVGIEAHHTCRQIKTRELRKVRLTDPERTFLDMARYLNLVDLVVLGDSLVGAQVTTPERLIAAARDCSTAGARRARHAAALVRRGVDSPMETRLRLLLVLAGLPEPVVNVEIRDHGGRVVYRIDLSYPVYRLGIEYEGRQHAEDARQWHRDITRREDLDGRDWRLILVRADGIYARPEETLDRIVTAMRKAGMELADGLPSQDWRRHFPGR